MTRIVTVMVLGFLGGVWARGAEPSAAPQTELGKLAVALQPGEMKELQTKGYTRELLQSWYDWEGEDGRKYGGHRMYSVALSWSHDACWDPKTRQVLFIGIGHYASMKFITYSADANEWKVMPVPTWADPRLPDGAACGAAGKDGNRSWPVGHTYDRLAISPEHRLFAVNWHGLYLYNIDSGAWTKAEGSNAGGKDAYQVAEYFPEMKAFIYEANWGRALKAWDVEKKAERRLGSYPFGIHGVMEYNPVHKVMVFGLGDGQGDAGATAVYRMDAQGRVDRLKPAPIHVNCREQSKLVCDPASGEFLVQEFRASGRGKVNAFHPIRDEWKEIPGLEFPAGLGVAVEPRGVLMFCVGDEVFLYKHKPAFSP